MPKYFSEREKKIIKNQLKIFAVESLINFGIKGTSIDNLVKKASISKGSFYLFFNSKEEMIFEIIEEMQIKMQSEMLNKLKKIKEKTADNVTEILLDLMKKAEKYKLTELMSSGEFTSLMRKLPEEKINSHIEIDKQMVKNVCEVLNITPEFAEEFSGAFRGWALMVIHKREIGKKVFDKSSYIVIKGIVMQILENKIGE
jgi:AcrR family transcriptional regulator